MLAPTRAGTPSRLLPCERGTRSARRRDRRFQSGSEPAVTCCAPPAGWPYGVGSSGVSDESIAARIERLVAEEHELRSREQTDSPDADALQADRERLRAVEVELNRCWDLLRQRRAREEFGLDPDDASARGADTIEEYEQ